MTNLKSLKTKPVKIYNDTILTYEQLDVYSERLASYLNLKTKRNSTPIIIYGHKKNEMLIGFLACIKSGNTYIPVDKNLPEKRLEEIVKNSNAKILINTEEDVFNFDNLIEIKSDKLSEIFEDATLENNAKNILKSEENVYIIYTSGSTGKPKGVQISVKNLESFLNWFTKLRFFKKNEDYIIMDQAIYSFDLSVMSIYPALFLGGTLYTLDDKSSKDMKVLSRNLEKSGINIWVSTPSFAEYCFSNSNFNKEHLPKLETMFFCGELLKKTTVGKIFQNVPEVNIINTYGPTEATVATTHVQIQKDMLKKEEELPVGKPDRNTELFIERTGEIIIGGDRVSKGYYNAKEKTEKAFYVENKKTYYKTGDKGYFKDDMLYFSGRLDYQIKLHGYRIELQDIEKNLRNIDYIESAVVVPIYKEGAASYLKGIIKIVDKRYEKESNLKMTVKIKDELKKRIPQYMIPKTFVILKEFPMNSNGKIDRKRLEDDYQ